MYVCVCDCVCVLCVYEGKPALIMFKRQPISPNQQSVRSTRTSRAKEPRIKSKSTEQATMPSCRHANSSRCRTGLPSFSSRILATGASEYFETTWDGDSRRLGCRRHHHRDHQSNHDHDRQHPALPHLSLSSSTIEA